MLVLPSHDTARVLVDLRVISSVLSQCSNLGSRSSTHKKNTDTRLKRRNTACMTQSRENGVDHNARKFIHCRILLVNNSTT